MVILMLFENYIANSLIATDLNAEMMTIIYIIVDGLM
jgi:hypothetical protein